MKSITYTLILGITILFASCSINYTEKIKGEGEIISEQIMLDEFNELQLQRGWDVILEPSTSNYMIVEANENLFEVFEYENKAGKLKVGASKQISNADSKQITIYFTEKLSLLKASSGTEVSSPENLEFDNLELDMSSGAEVNLDLELFSLDLETSSGAKANLTVDADDVFIDSSSGSSATLGLNAISTEAEASSGSRIDLEGNTTEFMARTSSGARINSKELTSKNVTAKASSGSSISVYPVESFRAETSSGGDVDYYNKPSGKVEINASKSGGSVKLK